MSSEIDPGYLLPGQQIGFYKILQRLGAGGFGAVYKVERDGELYALKIATFKLADLSPEERQRQEERADREVVALKSLRHPNIVRVHAFERWPDLREGFPFLVMDYVDGSRLYNWAAANTPTMRRICEVFIKIALALNEMHRIELYHRDLKSENVLIRASDGEPIILDFGISRPRSAYTVTRDHTMLGTFSHFAPEYCSWFGSSNWKRGERFQFQPTTDLHAVGYMLYEMLTGRSPFPPGDDDPRDDMATLNRIVRTVPVPPNLIDCRIPESLSAIVMRLLEKDPARRFQTGADLANTIRTALDAAASHADQIHEVAPNQVPRPTPLPRQATRQDRHGAESAADPEPPTPLNSGDLVVVPSGEATPPWKEEVLLVVSGERHQSSSQSAAIALPSVEIPVEPLSAPPSAERPSSPVPSAEKAALPQTPPASGELAFNPPSLDVTPAAPPASVRSVSRRTPSSSAGAPPPAPAPLPVPGAHFTAPSVDAARFSPPEPQALQAQPAPPPEAPILPSAIRRAADQLESSSKANDRSKNLRLIAAVAGVVLLLGLLSLVSSGQKPDQPRSLLTQVETAAPTAEPAARSPEPVKAVDPIAELPPAPPIARPVVPEPSAPPRQRERASGPAADIDQMLEDTYGRPSVSASGATTMGRSRAPSSPEPTAPQWLQHGQRVDAPAVATASESSPAEPRAKVYGVPTGAHIRVRLVSNLDSRTISSGPVEVTLVRPFLLDGALVFPSRTMLYGSASTNGDRFDVRFTQARLPDKTELEISGIAFDLEERKPGVRASRRIAAAPSDGQNVVGDVAKGAAGTVLNTVTGGLAQDLARGAGQTVVNGAGDSRDSSAARDVLLLDAGVDFTIFVAKPF